MVFAFGFVGSPWIMTVLWIASPKRVLRRASTISSGTKCKGSGTVRGELFDNVIFCHFPGCACDHRGIDGASVDELDHQSSSSTVLLTRADRVAMITA